MSDEQAVCELCGEPMPPGEEVFKYHGYSGPCPKPALKQQETGPKALLAADYVTIPRSQHEALMAAAKALEPFASISGLVEHTDRRDGERVFELPNPGGGYYTLVREDFRRAGKALAALRTAGCIEEEKG